MDMPEARVCSSLAPIVKDRKGIHKSVFETLQRQGYVLVRANGEIYEVSEPPELDRARCTPSKPSSTAWSSATPGLKTATQSQPQQHRPGAASAIPSKPRCAWAKA